MLNNLSHIISKLQHSRGFARVLLLVLPPLCIGSAAVSLAYIADHAFAFFMRMTGQWWWWPFLALPLGGVAVTLLIRKAGQGAEGSGIQQTIAALQMVDKPERIDLFVNMRLACCKFVAIVGGAGSGFVLGLEGPTVQIGASIYHAFHRLLPVDSQLHRRQIIMAGGAAGIAAAFNAPMAGIVFAIEEMLPLTKGNTLSHLLLAVILAGVVVEPVYGYQSYFGHIPFRSGMPFDLLPLVLLLAVVGGLLGGLFSWLAVRSVRWLPFPAWRQRHPYLFVGLCGLLIALAGTAAPIYGSGAELTKELLAGETQLSWWFLPLKLGGFLLTYLTGLPGGVFSPSLSLGAGLGYFAAPFVDPAWHTELVTIGMVAVLAAVTRAPLTAAFIMIEMTSGQNMVPQALVASVLAAWVAGIFRVHFYHDLANSLLAKEKSREESPQPAVHQV